MKKVKKVLLLGSGGLKIGQAGEFDYSGSQAIRALKEESVTVVLINPNIATVQTDEESLPAGRQVADVVYFLPLTLDFATRVIEKERPDAILLGFGGQTALNLGLALDDAGVLKKFKVAVLGTSLQSIRDTEDRELFVRRLAQIGVKTAKGAAARSIEEARRAARTIGFPVMVRSGFALGGEGSGVMRTEAELVKKLQEVFRTVPQVLIEENLAGWKEIEYEVVRDAADNCITVCNMENIDPMGIHTGESIVIAPSQTLSNEEYHRLREIAIRTIRHLGIVGECNIQYALEPSSSNYRVIEVNARLSRSSALASKATGYPLAYVAAKLALGQRLTDLRNSVTGVTTACFEPALDYVVLKMPRWDLAKFDGAAPRIGTEMKSVGEVMAIGRSFEEVLQKAIRMLNIGARGFEPYVGSRLRRRALERELKFPTTDRVFALAGALRMGMSVERICALTRIDAWFVHKMRAISDLERTLAKKKTDRKLLLLAKRAGFSDDQIGTLIKVKPDAVRTLRTKLRVLPSIKRIDTLAGEFPAKTNYLYLTYHGAEHDILPGKHQAAVIGSGPYSIGSSVEFDWSCVQALRTLKLRQFNTIMINSNPETVSTDYDQSDRLYFEELSLERVLDIMQFERPHGVVVSTGGQIPNNLARKLAAHRVPILGTAPCDIDRAENRHVFSKLLDEIGVDQPAWAELTSPAAARKFAREKGYPVLVRPSYVLSGSAMRVVYDEGELKTYLRRAAAVSREYPVVISKFVENAREIEIDGVSASGTLVIYAITEHIENAGTHSGDATVVLPAQRTYIETIRRAKEITRGVIGALKITGPFNIQFLAKDNHLQVIECNVRASRSFPFVSKVTGYNFIDIAIRAMLGEKVSGEYRTLELDMVAVKSPQFSYSRIKGADPVASVEMGSTGEVACFGDSYSEALITSMMAAGFRLPQKNILVSLGGEENKLKLLPALEKLAQLGFRFFGTEHTADFMNAHRIRCKKVYKLHTRKHPNVGDLLVSKDLDLIINIQGLALKPTQDGFVIRRRAIDMNIPLITNRQLAEAFIMALVETKGVKFKTKAWSEYRI